EQAAGKSKAVGRPADIYALGAVLYELLTGRPPFVGETKVDTIQQVQTAEPVSPGRLRPKIPRDLETICLKCLEKEPDKRYASAAALAADLGRFLAGEPIIARPASAWEHTVKWARRRPAVAALLAVIMLVFSVGMVGIIWQWQEARLARGVADEKAQTAIAASEQAKRNLYDRTILATYHQWLANNL